MTLASPGSWLQLFSMRCCWVWDEAFPSLIVCEVPAVNVVALKIIGVACNHDMSQRRHNRVEIACLYMIILVSSVPMYGGFEVVLGHEKGTWSCLCQAPGGNVVKVNIPMYRLRWRRRQKQCRRGWYHPLHCLMDPLGQYDCQLVACLHSPLVLGLVGLQLVEEEEKRWEEQRLRFLTWRKAGPILNK
jgi:hypothetical protein